ncbi:MAG: hypothetical protein H0V09_06720 [Gemmatimonadetes bacterium]|nr:hypothetical protein [Gemmatimonadota bacterium]
MIAPAKGGGDLSRAGRTHPAGGAADLPLDRVREQAEAFQEEINRGYYEALAGHRDSPGLEETYARYPELFDARRVEEVRAALDVADPAGDEGRRLRYLLDFLASGVEEEAGKEAEERYLTAEANAIVHVAGEAIPFRGVRVRIRNTPDRLRRREIAEAALLVSRTLQPHLRAGIEVAHEAARALGARDYVGWRAGLSGFDFERLLELTRIVLVETEAAYLDLFEYFARRELGLPRSEVRFWDLPHMLRGARFDAVFGAREMVDRVGGVVREMGLDPTAGGNVALDLDDRPRKSARAFCSPIRIPSEVKLVILPAGGADDYQAFLHELGHALHFGYVDPSAPFEFRNLGDNSITECYAATFDHCLLMPHWLRDVSGLEQPREFLLLQWFEELFMLRRYSAKLRYELELHARGPAPELADLYAEELERATGVVAPRERYLEDVDPRFYSVCYLQSWMLCGLLHRKLRERFDVDWYRNPRTGSYLSALFARGQRETAAELATMLGGPLDFDALLAWVREGLDRSP